MIGFAFGFTTMKYSQGNDNFHNPGKSRMITLTMVLQEFSFGDIYDNFTTNKMVGISCFFIMFLLLLLVIFRTITMVNLFVAATIKDMEQLKKEVYGRNLINMTENSIVVEQLLPKYFLRKLEVEKSATICMHRICNCEGSEQMKRLQGFQDIKDQIQKIGKLQFEV